MGVVYKAQDLRLDRTVALKFLPPDLTRDEEAKERFIQEAKAASSLDHNNICNIHEIGETDDGQIFIAMACYEGETLEKKIERGPLKVEEAIETALQIAQGLEEAHKHQIIHRDIKPANVLIINSGIAKILDFGLAKLAGRAMLTKADSTLGTVAYMSPEQTKGAAVDHRTDIWSLGVVLYEMIAGRPPFRGEYDQATVYGILNETPEPLTVIRTGLPVELERIIGKALAKDPGERYQHVDEMLVDLKGVQKESVPSVKMQSATGIGPKRKTTPIMKYVAVTAVLALIVFGFFLVKSWPDNEVFASKPIPIAVITFENQTGDTTYNYLKKVIPNLLITDLEQSKYLQVATWERLHDILRQMGRKETEFIDEETGFELCRKDNIPALAMGSVTKAGNVFVTDVKVLDVETKRLLKSVRSQGEGVESILRKQVDDLGKEIARGVGLTGRKVETMPAQIAEVTTKSIDAYNYFIRGREEYEKYYFIEAIPFLEKAVNLDSTFAMAYLYLGRAYHQLENTRAQNENYRKARAISTRTSEKERLYIEASYAGAIGRNPGRQFEILKTLKERFPKEKNVYIELGMYYQRQGYYDKAIETIDKALVLDPDFGYALNQTAYLYIVVGDYGKAIKYFEKYASVNPGDANPFDSMGDMYFLMGDLDLAKAKYEEAVGIKGNFVSSYKIAYICALMEDYPAALKSLDFLKMHMPGSNADGGPSGWKSCYYYLMGERRLALSEMAESQRAWSSMGNKFYVALMDNLMAWYLLGLKEYDRGLRLAEEATAALVEQAGPSLKPNYLFNIALYRGAAALETGKTERAVQQIKAMETQLPLVEPSLKDHDLYLATLFRGVVLFARGKTDSVIALCRQVRPSRPDAADLPEWFLYTTVSLYPPLRDVLARAYLEKGQATEAIAEYERLSTFDPKGEGRLLICPEYHYSLAKLYEKAGSGGKAVSEYEKLIRIWKNADSDLPELIDARIRLAKLTRGNIK